MKLYTWPALLIYTFAPGLVFAASSHELPGDLGAGEELLPPQIESAPSIVASKKFHHTAPESAFSGVTLTLDVFSPNPILGGGAMARRVGEAAFKPFHFSALEDNYYTIDLPANFVSAPGIEYYLYLDDKAGVDRRSIAWGTPIDPIKVRVEGGVNTGKELERYRFGHELRGFGETYHFPAAGQAVDTRVTEFESEYIHRFFGPVYSVHYGQGLYQSHVVTALTATATSYEQQPGFFYSFLEVNFSTLDSRLSLALKGMGGALSRQTGGGYEARVRYGDELGMNVSVGVRGIQTMGNAVNLNMRVRPLTWLSLGLGGEIGNLPDAKTLGFREYADFEFELGPQFKIMLRAGASAYNIQQTDGDFGGGLTYEF